jgi:hypothetical protein
MYFQCGGKARIRSRIEINGRNRIETNEDAKHSAKVTY